MARTEIESVVRAFAFMENQEGMGRIRKVTFVGSRLGVHIWIDGCIDPHFFLVLDEIWEGVCGQFWQVLSDGSRPSYESNE